MDEKLTPDEKSAFSVLSKEEFDTSLLGEKIADVLQTRKLIEVQKNTIIMKKLIWQAAASVAILMTGYFLGNKDILNSNKTDQMNKYALFLYENEEFTVEDGNTLVSEYSAWAENLGNQQKLLYAEKLNDDEEYWLGKPSVQNNNSKLTGYFVFYARDSEEAQEIARTHPHTRYGGGLELRPIDRID